jgi:hypothetical protein
MKSSTVRSFVLLVLVSLFATTLNVRASGPVSMYAVLERVAFEPNETAADRIQIWGAFAYVQGGLRSPSLTSDPQRGTMYFRLPANAPETQKQAIRKEWADLKAVAGTGQAIGFGSWFYFGDFSQAPGNGRILAQNADRSQGSVEVRVRKDSDAKGEPTVYTTDSGLVKLPATGSHAAVVAQLKALLKK